MNQIPGNYFPSGRPREVRDTVTDNRDIVTTWIWFDHTQRYIEVNPWELVTNAIENAHIDLSDSDLDLATEYFAELEGDLPNANIALNDRINEIAMRMCGPELQAELSKQDPHVDALAAFNANCAMVLGALFFHATRTYFDYYYDQAHQVEGSDDH